MVNTNGKLQEIKKFSELFVNIFIFIPVFISIIMQLITLFYIILENYTLIIEIRKLLILWLTYLTTVLYKNRITGILFISKESST